MIRIKIAQLQNSRCGLGFNQSSHQIAALARNRKLGWTSRRYVERSIAGASLLNIDFSYGRMIRCLRKSLTENNMSAERMKTLKPSGKSRSFAYQRMLSTPLPPGLNAPLSSLHESAPFYVIRLKVFKMKTSILVFSALIASLAFSVSFAQPGANETTKAPVRFMVTLSEYQLGEGVPDSATESEILDSIRKKTVQPTETIRLSVIKDVEGMAQFGKVANVTVGKTVNRDVTTRQTQNVQVGTLLKATVRLENEAIVASIAFEASRLQGNGTEDSPPDIASTTITTTQSLEFGKPCLIGSSSGGKTSYVFVTITQLH